MRPAIFIILCALPCLGQGGGSELFGTVEDPGGRRVPHASVTAELAATGARFTTQSNAQGEYHVTGLPVGGYTLRIEAPGFQAYARSGIVLRLSDRTEIEVHLEIGQPTQTV